jgi:hypothetical protein
MLPLVLGAIFFAGIHLGIALGFFSSLQFSSMNSMAYADIETTESSMASTITS